MARLTVDSVPGPGGGRRAGCGPGAPSGGSRVEDDRVRPPEAFYGGADGGPHRIAAGPVPRERQQAFGRATFLGGGPQPSLTPVTVAAVQRLASRCGVDPFPPPVISVTGDALMIRPPGVLAPHACGDTADSIGHSALEVMPFLPRQSSAARPALRVLHLGWRVLRPKHAPPLGIVGRGGRCGSTGVPPPCRVAQSTEKTRYDFGSMAPCS
ncbi:hypothetical protein GCM10010392_39300 [Streptomyces clavifer]|nr:hypothetical protein GCM10010392_39300 [Streptomyces clavifer]